MRFPSSIVALIIAPLGLVLLALSPLMSRDGDANIPPGHAGGPVINDVGGLTCSKSGCHIGTTPTNGSLSTPDTYEVGGEAVQFTVNGVRGMQVTVTDEAGTMHVGNLIEGGGLLFAQGNQNYLTHDVALEQSGSFTVTWQPPSTDVGPVEVHVAGSNGFVTQTWTSSATLDPEVSNQLPTITITEGPTGTVDQRNVLFAWTAADADGTVTDYLITLEGPTPSTLTISETSHEFTGLENGSYTFEIRAMDNEGGLSPIATQSFEIDAPNSAPTVSIASGPSGVINQSTASFQWEGSDVDGTIASYDVDLDGPTSSSLTTITTFRQFEALEDGEYTFQVQAIDDEGATSEPAVREFTVAVNPQNAAPTAAFTWMPIEDGLTLSFDATASSDGDGSIAAWSWDFGDGTSGTGETTDHTYATGGTYTVTLTVTDDDDATASSVQEVSAIPVSAEDGVEAPESFAIESVYPNPFNPSTTAIVAATRAGLYTLRVYDLLGKLVFSERLNVAAPGRQSVDVNLQNSPSGTYLIEFVEESTGRRVSAETTLLK